VISGAAKTRRGFAICLGSFLKFLILEIRLSNRYENLSIVWVKQPDLFPDRVRLGAIALFEVVLGQRRVVRFRF